MTRWGIVTRGALGLAAVWSVALVVLEFVVPTYGTSTQPATVDGSAPVTTGTATLVQVNGGYVVLLMCVPLVVTGLVAIALRYADHKDARLLAWMMTLIYGAFCVLALMSVGIFLMPVAIALVVACAAARRGPVTSPPLPEVGISPVR